MTLNINAPLTNDQSHEALAADVLNELTSISFRDWMGALKRFHQGSLSLIHLNVLMVLRSEGPLPMSRLADLLDVSVASATGIVDRMEKRGIVERRHSDADRRVVEVHTTDQATQLLAQSEADRRQRLTKLIEAMSDRELASLLTGLRAFRAARERYIAAADQPVANPGPS